MPSGGYAKAFNAPKRTANSAKNANQKIISRPLVVAVSAADSAELVGGPPSDAENTVRGTTTPPPVETVANQPITYETARRLSNANSEWRIVAERAGNLAPPRAGRT